MLKYLKYIVVVALCVVNLPVFAFHGAIEGRVLDSKHNPLVGTQVWLEGYKIGDVTDTAGWYEIKVPMHGEFKVVYQYIGFSPETLIVMVLQGERVRKDVILRESAIQLKEREVKGRREDIYKVKTPEPTIVIPREAAERVGAVSLGEALKLETGVKFLRCCAMCQASEISIQGLPGRFSLVLVDEMPTFSGIAAKYILDMFPVDFMDETEILKGASGAIWGSDAIAGAVNVVLPQPSKKIDTKTSFTYRNYGSDFSGMLSNNFITTMFARSSRVPVDLNNDNVSENAPFLLNTYLASMRIGNLNFGGSFIDEVRKAGPIIPESEYPITPGAEKVLTRRYDFWHQNEFRELLKFKLAISSHGEEGIMEMKDYSAKQRNLYGELSGKFKTLTSGVSLADEVLSDTRLFESYEERDFGIWASSENRVLGIDFLAAGRIDFNSNYGTILSPYGAMKFSLGETDFNLAVGTGFRTPSIIFESIQALPHGYRYVIRRDKNLTKESSVSYQCGLGRMFIFENFMSDIRVNLFHHRVNDFITAKFEGIDSVSMRGIFYYYNLDEIATSTGIELSSAFAFLENISLNLSAFALVPKFGDEVLLFINRWGSNYSVTYNSGAGGFEFNITGEINGPMAIEKIFHDGSIRKEDSPIYSVLNTRVSKSFGSITLIGGVNNVFDYYTQPNPNYKTEYFVGPMIGREFYGRVSIKVESL